MSTGDDINIAVAVGTLSLALATAYVAAGGEIARRLEARRRNAERVLKAAVELANAAAGDLPGQAIGAAHRRLHAAIQVAGVTGFQSTELMLRADTADNVVKQSEAALLEIGARLDELTPRPLLMVLLRRPIRQREIRGGWRI